MHAEAPSEISTRGKHRALLVLAIGILALAASLLNLAGALISSGCLPLFYPGAAAVAAGGLSLALALRSHSALWRCGVFLAALSCVTTLVAVVILVLKPMGRPDGNELQALGDSREVISAQLTWASRNGGFFEGDFECLSTPRRCLPDYPDEAPPFLGKDVTRLGVRSEYRRTFHPGPPAPRDIGASDGRSISPTSVVSFAYVARPVSRRAGGRSFCVDSTQAICVNEDGSLPGVVDGRCEPCQSLR
jgi:hypothetical protein